jgi:nicotinamide riboside transporter PnuC
MKEVEYYIRGLFRDVAQTEALIEQREELSSHITDHIADAMAAGLDRDAAFEKAIASLGNLDELIDTITGRRRRVRSKRANMICYLAGLCWGTLYLTVVGFWFAAMGFGSSALFVAIPGWLGYCIPFLFVFIDWRRHPNDTEVIAVDMSAQVKRALIIWIAITLACFSVNLVLSWGTTFLHVFWSWMPMAGLFTMPLMYWVYGQALKRDKPEPAK